MTLPGSGDAPNPATSYALPYRIFNIGNNNPGTD
jgi:hypothetical protein